MASGYRVRAALRGTGASPEGAAEVSVVGDIHARTDWSAALQDVELVVHAAARVHAMHGTEAGDALHVETNALGTQALAAACARAQVRQFVLLSSVKVNGDQSHAACSPSDVPDPRDAYGRSKWQAEQQLAQICATGAMQYTIVRAPLVYGAGVRANFLRLIRWIDRGYPLPFGAIRNKRSLVNVWNLVDLVECTLRHPAALNRTWMVSDGEDLSTADLARRIAAAIGRPARIWSVPQGALRMLGSLTGHSAEILRLCDSLCVNMAQTQSLLGWTPPVSVDAGLAKTIEWYRSHGRC